MSVEPTGDLLSTRHWQPAFTMRWKTVQSSARRVCPLLRVTLMHVSGLRYRKVMGTCVSWHRPYAADKIRGALKATNKNKTRKERKE